MEREHKVSAARPTDEFDNMLADRAARAAKEDFIRGFSQGYVQARRDVMLTPKDQRRARQAADALEKKIDAAISANTTYATAQAKVTALIAKATIAGAQDALNTLKARRGK